MDRSKRTVGRQAFGRWLMAELTGELSELRDIGDHENAETGASDYGEADADGGVLVGPAAGEDDEDDEDDVGDTDALAEAAGDVDADEEGLAEADRLGDTDADAVGDVDERTDGDADALAVGDVLWPADALAEDETFGEADAPEAVIPAGVDAVREETCAAGDGAGASGCPVKAVTAKPATDAATRKPMTHASTSGRHRRRRGRCLPPGGGPR